MTELITDRQPFRPIVNLCSPTRASSAAAGRRCSGRAACCGSPMTSPRPPRTVAPTPPPARTPTRPTPPTSPRSPTCSTDAARRRPSAVIAGAVIATKAVISQDARTTSGAKSRPAGTSAALPTKGTTGCWIMHPAPHRKRTGKFLRSGRFITALQLRLSYRPRRRLHSRPSFDRPRERSDALRLHPACRAQWHAGPLFVMGAKNETIDPDRFRKGVHVVHVRCTRLSVVAAPAPGSRRVCRRSSAGSGRCRAARAGARDRHSRAPAAHWATSHGWYGDR